jgi:hypothetical protein
MDYSFSQISEAYSILWEWELTEDYNLIDCDGITQFSFSSFDEMLEFTMGEDDMEAYLGELT